MAHSTSCAGLCVGGWATALQANRHKVDVVFDLVAPLTHRPGAARAPLGRRSAAPWVPLGRRSRVAGRRMGAARQERLLGVARNDGMSIGGAPKAAQQGERK